MRVAALDLGSNSFHLLVADVHPDGTIDTVTREKEMLRLGDAVARTGAIGRALLDRSVDTVRRMRGVAEAAGANEVLAKATSAVRSATDGSELVDRVEAEAGVHVDVIDGLEEARLVFGAIRSSVVIDPAPAVCLDLGGGSLEVMVGDAGGLRWATSLPLGVARLTAEHVHDDPLPKADRKALEAHVREVLDAPAAEVARHAPALAVGSSGTLSDLAAITAAEHGRRVERRNQLTVTRDELRAVHHRLVRSDGDARRRLSELEAKRVDLVVAGSVVLDVALDLFAVERFTVSEWALREGIILDAVRTHDPDTWSDEPRALRRSSVAALARRCSSDEAHTARVASLALAIFDGTRPLHDLGPAERELLEHGARLHDIGQHVSPKGHHKHAAYLVHHGGLRGFDPDEVAMLAALVRWHRHGEPKPSEEHLGALDADRRDRVVRLAGILRVADGLDRGRRGAVRSVDAQVTRDLVLLRVVADADPELELWGARRRRELFERVFDRELELTVTDGAWTHARAG